MTNWDHHFQGVHQVILPNITSDHFTILFQVKEVPSARCPFKFKNKWLEVESFCDLLKSFRGELNASTSPSFILAKKILFGG